MRSFAFIAEMVILTRICSPNVAIISHLNNHEASPWSAKEAPHRRHRVLISSSFLGPEFERVRTRSQPLWRCANRGIRRCRAGLLDHRTLQWIRDGPRYRVRIGDRPLVRPVAGHPHD